MYAIQVRYLWLFNVYELLTFFVGPQTRHFFYTVQVTEAHACEQLARSRYVTEIIKSRSQTRFIAGLSHATRLRNDLLCVKLNATLWLLAHRPRHCTAAVTRCTGRLKRLQYVIYFMSETTRDAYALFMKSASFTAAVLRPTRQHGAPVVDRIFDPHCNYKLAFVCGDFYRAIWPSDF